MGTCAGERFLERLDELWKKAQLDEILLVYTDESYIHPSYAATHGWYHVEDDDRCFGSPKGRGRRIVMIHFACKTGWIPSGKYVWDCTGKETTSTEDYHGNVDAKRWLEIFGKVCRDLHARGKKAVFIMDNARYHKSIGNTEIDTKFWPTRRVSNALKNQLKTYLNYHQISFNNQASVEELRDLARKQYQATGFHSLELARRYGHTILFTPPYWPQLQPIEMAWGIVKNGLQTTEPRKATQCRRRWSCWRKPGMRCRQKCGKS